MSRKEPEWAKYITEDNIENEDLQALMSVIGFEATKKLMIYYEGMNLKIPKSCNMKYKHQYALDTHDGSHSSRVKIVRECDITENYIFKIMKKYPNKKVL
ncbi:hypothetical protein IJ541_04610 [bacterium]|nr:hypothetical protein [bacterium]